MDPLVFKTVPSNECKAKTLGIHTIIVELENKNQKTQSSEAK
jgi:hypothetical protein